jgi:hypothetical protein
MPFFSLDLLLLTHFGAFTDHPCHACTFSISAVILACAVQEEDNFSRQKHAFGTGFPSKSQMADQRILAKRRLGSIADNLRA